MSEVKKEITLYAESEEVREVKNPDKEKSSETPPLSRLKQERLAKAEKKKAIKAVAAKFGSVKLAKKMVKTAVKNINTRRNSGRGR